MKSSPTPDDPPPAPSLIHGDCLTIIPTLAPSTFRLIYVDPPFFTASAFKNRKGEGGFSDMWDGKLHDYLAFLRPRIEGMRDLLASDGSFLLHLDWRAVHYAKVMCDEIFGRGNFQNEIIWSYNSGGGSKMRYGRKHDTILWYGKTARPYFDAKAARVPHSAHIASKRKHLFHPEGKVRGDVLEISRPPNHSPEWTGWPTQKPLALLQLLVRCHSEPGDLVGDFFCGSGTALAAALTEGRKAFGCDLSKDALAIARERIAVIEGTKKA